MVSISSTTCFTETAERLVKACASLIKTGGAGVDLILAIVIFVPIQFRLWRIIPRLYEIQPAP